ncbi:PAS domain-containing sensor histidine kinase [Halorubrum sp. DTA98]|uniref:sensor histidine kinase n=1 Tax=Halorubrum sp. DTA98 TaxID=3402163 RepID=UPI003AB0CC00
MDRFADVLPALPDATLVVDRDGVIVSANRRVEPVLGYAPAELAGRSVEDILHTSDQDERDVIRESYLRDPRPRPMGTDRDLYASRGDGTEVPVTISLGPVEGDDGTHVIVTVVDVSRDREREATLHRRTETLAALHHATQDLLKTTEESAAAEAAVGYVDDVLGLPMAAVWLYDEDDGSLVPAAWTEFADDVVGAHPTFEAAGASLIAETFETGEPRYVRDTYAEPNRYNPATPIRSEFIVPLGRYGVLTIGATDADALDEADRTVARLWGATVTMVLVRIERERQLRAREVEVAHERDRLAEFASLVSHDLRNPLNVAAGHLEMALSECESEDLAVVSTSIDRMEALVDDMLTLARQGEAVDATEAVELATIVDDCWTTVDTADATVTVRDDLTINADRSRLAQLLENLFRNSIEHGGDDVRVVVEALPDADGFSVADDGPGVEPERREEVFETSVTTNPNGTGFGLRIVSEIAEAHGWSVDLVASDSGGARFEFRGVDVVAPESFPAGS